MRAMIRAVIFAARLTHGAGGTNLHTEKQNMDYYWQQVREAAAYVRDCIGPAAVGIGIITGTGLSQSMVQMQTEAEIEYKRIPHFPASTVKSHAGCLIFGRIHGRRVFVMQGRFHLYEGYSALRVSFPVRVMQALGVENLIVTNAAGGQCRDFVAGDIMAISDHINLTGENPLVGPNHDEWGIRFPDMSAVYDFGLMDCAADAARKSGIALRKGVYAGLKGPSLETPAELRFLRRIGADAVGLSTVVEVIAAVHAQMRICGFSMITNIADPDHPEPATLEAVIQTARNSAPRLGQLVSCLVKEV